MRIVPKKIDAKVKERCVRLVLDHLSEYPSVTAAAEAVARREGVGKESVRRWVVQAQIDGGQRQGATSEELAEIKELKVKVRRLEEDNEILRRGGCRTNVLAPRWAGQRLVKTPWGGRGVRSSGKPSAGCG